MTEDNPHATGRHPAIMTTTDREYISDPDGVDDNKRHQAISRVRQRINNELPHDIAILAEHHPRLLDELRDVVCTENGEH